MGVGNGAVKRVPFKTILTVGSVTVIRYSPDITALVDWAKKHQLTYYGHRVNCDNNTSLCAPHASFHEGHPQPTFLSLTSHTDSPILHFTETGLSLQSGLSIHLTFLSHVWTNAWNPHWFVFSLLWPCFKSPLALF